MRTEFETPEALRRHLDTGGDLRRAVLQGLDLRPFQRDLQSADLRDTVFLGCTIPPEIYAAIQAGGAVIFPQLPDTPYRVYRGGLYTPEELQGDYVVGDEASYDRTLDGQIYRRFQKWGANPADVVEALTRRIHDLSITDALQEFIAGRRVVAIMGGHSMPRDSAIYLEVAKLGRELTRRGYLVATGGGPGAMESAHVGAWFATRSESELQDAVGLLSLAPTYQPKGKWLDAAMAVAEKYPVQSRQDCESLGIPTWLYGHEPPARFALTIAKYFANSVREEGLLAIAKGGVVFTPGNAGTIQEIFQDACQNRYRTFDVASPMVFLGRDYWMKTKPIYPLLQELAREHAYGKLLSIHDQRESVLCEIDEYHRNHPV